MKKIKWTLKTGYHGADHHGQFEVPDDMTDDEIQKEVEQDAYQYVYLSWEAKTT